MGALLALITAKDWVYGALIALIVGGGLYWHHAIIEKGIADQVAADNRATALLKAETAKETADLKARADMAERAYEKEAGDNANYRSQHPVGPVRLCSDSAHGSGPVLPEGGTANTGNAPTGPSPGPVQPLPSGNSGFRAGAGPDIANLLDLLAARADETSATLREYQARE